MSQEWELSKTKSQYISVENTIKHLKNNKLVTLRINKTRVYKNIGLIDCQGILVWLSFYDINNINIIASKIYNELYDAINLINIEYPLDLGNTLIKFNKAIDPSSSLALLIEADYDHPEMISSYNKFHYKS